MNGRQERRRLGYVAKGSRFVPGSRTRAAVSTGTMSVEAVPPAMCGRCWREMILRKRGSRSVHLCQRCDRRIGANELTAGVLIGIYERRRDRGQVEVDLEQLANALGIKPVEVGEDLSWVGVNQDTLSLHWAEHGGMSKTAVVGAGYRMEDGGHGT
jgi:hypothetical protein